MPAFSKIIVRGYMYWVPVLIFLLWGSPVLANLMLAPTRVVFEKNQRAAQLDLINTGTETATYRIKLVNRRMSENGELLIVETPEAGEQFADTMLRYSPRQVVLAPNAAQVVRVMVRKPADLVPGEYRSHLLFERIADTKPRSSSSTGSLSGDKPPEDIQINLSPLIGVSIPVIIRHGQTSANMSIAGLSLERPKSANEPALLSFELHRSGDRSVYGDLIVTFKPEGGSEQQVARANGIAVYTPNALRRGKIQLNPPFSLTHSGLLRMTYQERADQGGKLLAEATLHMR